MPLLMRCLDHKLTDAMTRYRLYGVGGSPYSQEMRGEALAKAADAIRQRQVGPMPLVGCTTQNKPVIEQSFHELLAILDTFAARGEYLFGTRPSLAG